MDLTHRFTVARDYDSNKIIDNNKLRIYTADTMTPERFGVESLELPDGTYITNRGDIDAYLDSLRTPFTNYEQLLGVTPDSLTPTKPSYLGQLHFPESEFPREIYQQPAIEVDLGFKVESGPDKPVRLPGKMHWFSLTLHEDQQPLLVKATSPYSMRSAPEEFIRHATALKLVELAFDTQNQ